MSGNSNGVRHHWTTYAWLQQSTSRYKRSLARALPALERLAKDDERLVAVVDAVRTALAEEVLTGRAVMGSVALLDRLMSEIEPPPEEGPDVR